MSERLFRFSPAGKALRAVRAELRRYAAELGAAAAVGDQLALMADELVNNAIEHGAAYRRRNLDLTLRIVPEGGVLLVEFHDREMPGEAVAELARALDAAARGMPSLDSERGRGLFLLTIYLQDLRAEPAADGGLRLTGRMRNQ